MIRILSRTRRYRIRIWARKKNIGIARTHAPHSAMQLVTVKSEMPLRNSLLHVAVINDLSTTY